MEDGPPRFSSYGILPSRLCRTNSMSNSQLCRCDQCHRLFLHFLDGYMTMIDKKCGRVARNLGPENRDAKLIRD
jgi:hypothetical protein